VLGFAAMQWATGSDLSLGHEATFGDTLSSVPAGS
jgi:hypothetical protein